MLSSNLITMEEGAPYKRQMRRKYLGSAVSIIFILLILLEQ